MILRFLSAVLLLWASSAFAQSTFDTTRNGSGGLAFSNGNLTATLNSSSDVSAFTTRFHSSGIWNFRFTPAVGSFYVGLASSTMASAFNTVVGLTADSVGIHDIDGNVVINSVVVGNTGLTYGPGNAVDIKVDLTAQTIQESVNGSALSSPISIASLSTFNLSPAGTLHVINNALTFSGSPPSSFPGSTPWNGPVGGASLLGVWQ